MLHGQPPPSATAHIRLQVLQYALQCLYHYAPLHHPPHPPGLGLRSPSRHPCSALPALLPLRSDRRTLLRVAQDLSRRAPLPLLSGPLHCHAGIVNATLLASSSRTLKRPRGYPSLSPIAGCPPLPKNVASSRPTSFPNHPGSPYARLATKPSSARRCPTASGASSPPRTKCTIFVNKWPRPYATSSPSSADGPQYDPPPSCRPCTPPRLVRLVPLRRALLHSFNIQANLHCPPSSSAAFAMTPCSLQFPSWVSTNLLVSLVALPLA